MMGRTHYIWPVTMNILVPCSLHPPALSFLALLLLLRLLREELSYNHTFLHLEHLPPAPSPLLLLPPQGAATRVSA